MTASAEEELEQGVRTLPLSEQPRLHNLILLQILRQLRRLEKF